MWLVGVTAIGIDLSSVQGGDVVVLLRAQCFMCQASITPELSTPFSLHPYSLDAVR